MPLVDLGLLPRFDNADAALLQRQASERSQRQVRCVAGFYASDSAAQAVAQRLVSHHGLRNDQVDVIRPDGLTRANFERHARRWRSLRPRWGAARLGLRLAATAVVGMLCGGLAATLGWAVLSSPMVEVDAMQWLAPGLLAGALAGGAAGAALWWRQPPHRFDGTVARKLGRGLRVVVAHGLDASQEAPVLTCLQDSSHSWCAEAPLRGFRL